MHKQRLGDSAELSSEGQLEVSPALAERMRQTPNPKPTLRAILRLPFLYVRNKIRRMKKNTSPSVLDEYGLPAEWRHVYDIFRPYHQEPWKAFENWCSTNSITPIPASSETILRYLIEVEPSKRRLAYSSIARKHESLYWHSDACAHCHLHVWFGFKVHDGGELTVENLEAFFERFGPSDQVGVAQPAVDPSDE